jgi:cytochrome c553
VKTVIHGVVMSCVWMSSLLMPPAFAAAVAAKARPVETKQSKAAALLKGDAVLGKEKADSERCIECHGADGHGAAHANSVEGKFAKLAGQHPEYMLKQIQDLRSGARKHDQMAIMARSVSDEDARDIAAYFASQPRMSGQGGELHLIGKALFAQGDPGRGIVACVSCHGVNGKGVAGTPLVPVIGGQEWRYLDKQLRDWRSGDRRNSQDGVMNKATSALSDKEIESLADYLSGL